MNNVIPKDSYVIIIGAMRSGTTSLFHYLSQHPKICPSKVKEPEFFSENQEHKLKDIRNYEDLWDFNESKHKYVLEASTGYTKYPLETGVPERMANYGIQPKLIYILRNPLERILSQFNFERGKWGKSSNCTNDYFMFMSNYYRQLELYAAYFSIGQILILDFDELRNDPKTLLKRVYTFLSIPPYFPDSFERVNQSTSYTDLDYKLLRLGLGRFVPGFAKPYLYKMKKTLLSKISRDITKKELTEEERDEIYSSLQPDMQKLKEEYGVNVEKWGF